MTLATETAPPVSHATTAARTAAPVLLVLLGVLWFASIDLRPLFEPDEGRYAEIPREMLVTGDYVTPRLDGFLYFEKPPLQYWATAGFYRILGVHAWVSRLWSVLVSYLTVLLVWFTGSRLFGPREGLFSALALAGFVLFAGLGAFNTLDAGVTFFLAAALCTFCLAQAQREEGGGRAFALLAWVAMALAVLSKGLIGIVLPGGVLLAYSLLQRDRRVWRHLALGAGLPVFLALTVPWFVLVSRRNPDFARFFFVHEHLQRFLDTGHHRAHPFYFFLLILIPGLLPFTGPAAVGLFRGFGRERPRGRFDVRRLLAVWTVLILLFFSLSESKLVGYIGPILPALALLAGPVLAFASRRMVVVSARVLTGVGALLLVLAAVAPLLPVHKVGPEMLRGVRPFLLAGGVILAVGGLLAAGAEKRNRRLRAVAAMSLAAVAGVLAVIAGAGVLAPKFSSRAVAARLAGTVGPDTPIYCVDRYDQSLPFYLGRLVHVVKAEGELEFGISHDSRGYLPDFPTFMRRWKADPRAVAILDPDDYEHFEKKGLPMRVLMKDPYRVVVEKP